MDTEQVKGTDKALKIFADLMIEKINNLKEGWEKPWLSCRRNGMPTNLSGRKYSSMNALMLFMLTEKKGWQMPIFMTFNQANEKGAKIEKGEKSFPVLYWNFSIKNRETGEKIEYDNYKRLSEEEQQKYNVTPYLKYYHVFNLQQTNFAKIHPERWDELLKKYNVPQFKDTAGMYANEKLDNLIQEQKWLCPIICNNPSNQAYFSPKEDKIILPMKAQYNKGGDEKTVYENGMNFYATAMHEMTHSTGTKDRLNRDLSGLFGDKEYGKEELVAELTSALIGQEMGFSKKILQNNAAYLDNWLKGISEEPHFLIKVLSDVNKATNLINNAVENITLQKKEENVSENKQKITKAELEQFCSLKEKYSDAIILFRVGDLYKTYSSDALSVSKTLDIAYTNIEKEIGGKIEIAEFPYHALDQHLPQLIKAGKKVAICDQIEKNRTCKNELKKEIDNNHNNKTSDEKENNKEPGKDADITTQKGNSEQISASVFKMMDGRSYAIRANINGEQFSAKRLNKKDINDFFNKKVSKEELACKYFDQNNNKRENTLKR